jgi:hypothetical protein
VLKLKAIMINKVKEIDIARPVVEYLKNLGWVVYQEVQIFSGGPRADIIAKQGNILWVVEAKTTLTFSVVEQAEKWLTHVHRASVAVPSTKRRSGSYMQEFLLRHFGIGLFTVNKGYRQGCDWSNYVSEGLSPRLNRKVHMTDRIINALSEEHKEWCPAGSNGGGYFTPFSRTRREILYFVKKNPGCTLKELIDGIDHHYASFNSAKGSIVEWIRAGIINDVRTERDGKLIRIYEVDKRKNDEKTKT